MDIAALLERKAVLPRLHAVSKRHALTAIAETAARLYGLSAAKAAEVLWSRERESSTGFGFGVALPHARIAGLDRVRGLFARLDAPVEFGSVDEKPVDLIFTLLAPPGETTSALRALACVSRAFRDPILRQDLRQARGDDAVHALLLHTAEHGAAA